MGKKVSKKEEKALNKKFKLRLKIVMLPVYKPVRFNVGYDVTSGALVLVELLRDEHPQLHPNLLHKPVHPKRGRKPELNYFFSVI